MPKAVKRKNDVITPTDLAQSDDEEPPQLTAQQIAKKAFRESLAEPVSAIIEAVRLSVHMFITKTHTFVQQIRHLL